MNLPSFISNRTYTLLSLLASVALWSHNTLGEDRAEPQWKYAPELLRPFWEGNTVEGESVLFIKNADSGEARATVLFPVQKVLAVQSSTGEVTYEEGRDFTWKPQSREIVLPAGSRIVSRTPDELRRPAKTQRYALTHRDGRGEILFGAELEYHQMQTSITYTHSAGEWRTALPEFAGKRLPKTIRMLREKQPLKIVLLGDSISTGCNASGWAKGAPYQPAYFGLLEQHLEAQYGTEVELVNLSVGGRDAPWGLTMADEVIAAKPNLVIIAFGMNDSAGRPAAEFKSKIEATIGKIREALPESEFILVATMLGNADWVALKQELFPQYRDALASLCGEGAALADLTSIWAEFLKRKRDWDLTGNGVNHPNDFGHRVYAQVLSTLLIPPSQK